jgi:hypothetical protein
VQQFELDADTIHQQEWGASALTCPDGYTQSLTIDVDNGEPAANCSGFSPKVLLCVHIRSFLLYYFCSPFAHEQKKTICRFHGKSFPWVKVVTSQPFCASRDARSFECFIAAWGGCNGLHGSDGAFRRLTFLEKPQGFNPNGVVTVRIPACAAISLNPFL